jgi:SAM-dependent MidA family methyltransferase
MSADVEIRNPNDSYYVAPVVVDPVADFNRISEHTALDMSHPPRRNLRPNGDPAAVEEIHEAIRAGGGRITFGQYMDIALYGTGGYYSTGKVRFQGGNTEYGDFYTSPEQSADFSSAMNVGVCAILGAMGKQPVNLLELGAGSGRMKKDLLAAMRNEDPTAYGYVTAYIADYGGMGERQRRVIGSSERAHTGSYAAMSTQEEHQQDLDKVLWIPGSALDIELDNGKPTIVMSNEVHDAVRTEVIRNNEGDLEQKYVALNDNQELTEEWGDLTEEIRAYIETYGTVINPGMEAAISPDVVALQRRICRLIRRGGWINIDYSSEGPKQYPHRPWTPRPVKMQYGHPTGDWHNKGAVFTYPHNYNPLQMPGELDLTHIPDFTVLRRVAAEAGMTEAYYGQQDAFMHLLGMPALREFEVIRAMPGLSEASIQRIADAQALPGGPRSPFRALVLTRGVEADFSTPRRPLSAYRDFY